MQLEKECFCRVKHVTALASHNRNLPGTRSKEGRFTPAFSDQMNHRGVSGRQLGVNRRSLLRFVSYAFAAFSLLILWTPAYSQSLAPDRPRILTAHSSSGRTDLHVSEIHRGAVIRIGPEQATIVRSANPIYRQVPMCRSPGP